MEAKKWKRGDIGPDGRVFLNYSKKCKNGEYWVTVDSFEKHVSLEKARNQTPEYKSRAKARSRARRQTPEYKSWAKTHRQTPEYKAWVKAYKKTPEYKSWAKARRQSPEYKAWQKAHRQTPEYKSLQKAYNKDYNQTITRAKTARSYMTALFAAQELSELLKKQQ